MARRRALLFYGTIPVRGPVPAAWCGESVGRSSPESSSSICFLFRESGREKQKERERVQFVLCFYSTFAISVLLLFHFQSCACPVLPLIPTSLVGSLRDCDTSSVQKRSSVAERWWWTLNRRLCLRKVCCSTEVGFYKKQSYFARGDFFGGWRRD